MNLSDFLDKVKTRHILLVSALVVAFNFLINIVLPARSTDLFNAVFGLGMALMAFAGISVLYFVSRQKKYTFTRTILIIGLSMASWVLGDATYLLLLSLNVDPFISFGDIFYISATLLLIAAALTIPGSQQPTRRRNMVFIEISILFLSAAIMFITLLFIPGNADLSYDKLTMFMVFIYPVLDIILLWILVILFFTYPDKSIEKVLKVLLAAAFLILISDSFYVISNLYSRVLENFLVDTGYYFFYVFLLISCLIGYKEIRTWVPVTENEKKVTLFKQGNWIVFLPGVFLITVIGLLIIFVLNQSFVLFHGSMVLIALIIILFIIHQYLVITDNIKLTREMREINSMLESKVEERTAELIRANEGLEAEMVERKKAEELLSQINQELALVNGEKDKLFSIIAHDLRSPMGSLMKLSELLVENIKEFDEDEHREVATTLHATATQTFNLLNDLLSWSAVQLGRGERKREILGLATIISGSIDAQRDAAAVKNISLFAEINQELVVFADKFALQTVLRNLISNAVKFTPRNGTIWVKAIQDNALAKISVIDNGIGIAKEKQEKLFRVDNIGSQPGTEGEKGTGFGLLLCRDLIKQNGGNIWLESEPGKGSTFHFTLPVKDEVAAPITHSEIESAARIDYKCIHSKKLAFSSLIGRFDKDSLRSELLSLWGKSEYKPDYPVLIDVRQAYFSIEVRDFHAIIQIFKSLPEIRIARKFAMLTSTPQQVAFATMFGHNIKSLFPVTVEVFSTYEAALSWLER